MNLPFEIFKNIFSHLETIDLLCVLTVCKKWYRPVYETLYSSVDIRSERSFRAFLYTIAHHELKFGDHVKKLSLIPEDKSMYGNSRSISFTEFDLLARHCPALEELYFHDPRYWKFLNFLDWDTTWLHLRRIPSANGGHASFRVYCKLGERVSDLEIGTFLQHSDLTTMLSQLTQLKELTLNKYTLDPINTDILNTIHRESPQLEHLMLKTRIDRRKTTLTTLPPDTLKSLACYIYSPDSPWFSLIQSYYSHISVLSLYILETDQERAYDTLFAMFHNLGLDHQLEDNNSSSSSLDYFKPLIDLYTHSSIPRIDVLFQKFIKMPQLEQLFKSLVQSSTTFSIGFTYYDSDDVEEFSHLQNMTERNLFISTTKLNDKQHHTVQYHSPIPPEQDEMLIFHHLPGTHLVTELTLTRKMVSEYQRSKVFLDELLYEFPRLQKMAVGCDRESCGLAYSISNLDFTKRQHLCLEELTFTCVRIYPLVLTFIIENCPRLTHLNMIECDMDEVAVMALDYFCLQQHIKLNIK